MRGILQIGRHLFQDQIDRVNAEIRFAGMSLHAVSGDTAHFSKIDTFAVRRDHVGRVAAVKRELAGWSFFEVHLIDAFLGEDARELGIRSKSDIRELLGLTVADHAGGTVFFVGSDDKTDTIIWIRVLFLKSEHRHVGAKHRSLVIDDTASDEVIGLRIESKCICLPGGSFRNNIKMSEDRDERTFISPLNVSGFISDVYGSESVRFRTVQKVGESLLRFLAVRGSFLRFSFDTCDADKVGKKGIKC